ncbi:hypothetical protein Clopa_2685 [Clostridium pasteurianum BC1]|uniref:Uncharacterized protein n=1 Tax=Clostridium pasteurianum BC1 TaxID=86416 RepID=R4K775_CLOPA|nr:hypothetical protein Clopa_2685 [Clostridium pasteurianum BC1]
MLKKFNYLIKMISKRNKLRIGIIEKYLSIFYLEIKLNYIYLSYGFNLTESKNNTSWIYHLVKEERWALYL